MRFSAFDRVETQGGRRGIVKTIQGRHVTVMFSDGDEFIDIDDLILVPQTPDEALLEGQLGDAEAFALRLRALYLRHAYRFDARSGLSNARVEPKLHQVYVAHRVTNKVQPRMLLADEVGLGKTIEAGLILKELRARAMVERVLIVCPASLQHQWRNELASKFNEQFEIMNAAAAKYLSQGKTNPFAKRDNIITSINFAQNERRQEQILEADWDLVIFDEAHRVRRSMQGGSKVNTTQAYRLADELKELAPGLLLLTATPMQLHPFELFSLVELVEPGLFRDYKDYDRQRNQLPLLNQVMRQLKQWAVLSADERSDFLAEHHRLLSAVAGPAADVILDDPDRVSELMDLLVDQHPLAEVMIRNRKSEIGGFAGREAHKVPVELRPDELQLYEDISEYLRFHYDLALTSKQNAVGFLMVTYQKMLASSPFAVLQSFKRRVAKLETRAKLAVAAKKRAARLEDPIDDVLDDLESAEVLEELTDETVTLDESLIQYEIEQLKGLIRRLEHLEDDSKASELLDALDTIWSDHPNEKVVIFTTFRDTQQYLQRLIEQHARIDGRPVKVARFNGALTPEEKEESIKKFRADHQVLISTESGGEGRNLQFAHILVNYDLPWNPMKVEQRIGRLDRIGQKRTVFIYNMACVGTVEERVLSVLENRIRLFTESVGSLDPILGELEGELASLVMRHTDRFDVEFDQIADDMERRAREARENERVLADFLLDRASLRRDEANRLLGEAPLATAAELEQFCRSVLDHSGGTLMPHSEGGAVITVSPKLGNRLRAKANQVRGAFDPGEALALEDLDFFAFGHELIDKIVDFPIQNEPVSASARRIDGLEGGPFIEAIYELRAEATPPIGRVVRHLIDGGCDVVAEEIRSVPDAGEPADVPVPAWASDALEASRQEIRRQQSDMRDEVLELHRTRTADEVKRARRIFEYRRSRLSRMIDQQEEWLRDARSSTSERTKKIIPAREGRLRKDRERLAALESNYEDEVAEISSRQPSVSGTLWSVSVVIGRG